MPEDRHAIVVVLGAGSSHPIVPLTPSLTQLLFDRARVDESAVRTFGATRQRLHGPMSDPPTFEALFDEILRQDYAAYLKRERWAEREATYPDEVVSGLKAIVAEIAEAAVGCIRSPIAAVLRTLANVADPLTVATLNWDDLALQARLPLPWYDGFVRQGPPPWPFLPDVAALGQVPRYVLLWLHGSVHWRQDDDGLWYWDPRTLTMALPHILQQDMYWPVEEWADGLRFDRQNPALPRFPVVISPHKDQQIQQGLYRFYWYVLDKALQAAQTLIIVGYSGRDAHLNAVLRKAVTHTPTLRQLIWIDKQTQVTELCETVAGVWGEPWRDVQLRRCDAAEGFSSLMPRADGNSLSGWVYSLGIEKLSSPGGLRTLKQILHHLTA